jgi:hypothetical protein
MLSFVSLHFPIMLQFLLLIVNVKFSTGNLHTFGVTHFWGQVLKYKYYNRCAKVAPWLDHYE